MTACISSSSTTETRPIVSNKDVAVRICSAVACFEGEIAVADFKMAADVFGIARIIGTSFEVVF